MKNLCSLSKLMLTISISFVGVLMIMVSKYQAVPAEYWNFYNPQAYLMLVPFVAVMISVYYTLKIKAFLDRISHVCGDIKVGNFESRIINTSEGNILGRLSHSVNNAIDVSDAFVRESSLVMQAVSEGRYHRNIRPEGLRGAFGVAVTGINKAISIIQHKDNTEKETKKNVDETIKAFVNLAKSVKAGNLKFRVDEAGFSKDFKPIIGGA